MTDIPSDVEPVSDAFETLWANSVALRDHAELGRQIKAHYDANYAPRCHHGLTLDACPACPNSSAEPDPRDAAERAENRCQNLLAEIKELCDGRDQAVYVINTLRKEAEDLSVKVDGHKNEIYVLREVNYELRAERDTARAELFAEQRMAIQRVLRIIALERQVASMAPVGAVHGAGAISASDGHAALHAALRRSGGDGRPV